MKRRWIASVGLLLVMTAGCASGKSSSPAPSGSVSPTGVRTTTASPADSGTAGSPTASPTDSGTPATPANSAATPTGSPVSPSGVPASPGATSSGAVISVAPGESRDLTLSDAFTPGNWAQGSYQLPGQTGQVQALGDEISCYASDSDSLEFRFAQASGMLTVEFGQDLRSATSDGVAEFSLVVDGRQTRTKSVTFKQTQRLTTPLANVAVVKITVKQVGSKCKQDPSTGKDLTALITKLTITG